MGPSLGAPPIDLYVILLISFTLIKKTGDFYYNNTRETVTFDF